MIFVKIININLIFNINLNKMEYSNFREKSLSTYGAILLTVLIATVGAIMMSITSSPQMKGAAMLWLPAAFQLIAGIWFGPAKGLLIGGIGAYAAGIIAYGGWGLVDIIMNLIAGGVANAWLPAILFKLFNINPSFNANPKDIMKSTIILVVIFILVLCLGILPLYIKDIKIWSYILAILLMIIAIPIAFRNIKINKIQFLIAFLICILVSAVSALIGSYGVVVGGNNWQAAILGTGIGWFLGDTVSCFLGLYILAYYTEKAVSFGIIKKV